MIDPRLVSALAAIARRHVIVITALRSDDSTYTVDGALSNHSAGPAIFSRPAATLTARLAPHTLVKRVQRLRLFVDLERAHFFEPTTQCALRQQRAVLCAAG